MAIEDIVNGILEKGNIEIENIRKNTEEQVKKIIKEAEEKAEKYKKEMQSHIDKEIEMEISRAISQKNLEMKKIYLEKVNEIIEIYFSQIKDTLRKLRGTQSYISYIQRSYKDALNEMGLDENSVIIEISEKDKVLFQKNKNVAFNQELNDLGGIIVKSKDGKRIFDRSLNRLLEDTEHEIKSQIYSLLKGE
ncbi:MAG: V-type ATP synthase subunit E [Thermoplasmata archaeon]